MRSLRKVVTFAFALLFLAMAATIIVYRSTPTHNTDLTHFDTIIVLGTPTNADGSPSPEQRERTLEGVRELKAGVASHLILTGGPAHNQFVEAHVMAALAIAQGVPPEDVIEEDQAQNTIQNIFYSQRIMASHNWNSAEVVSSSSHLPRTALILQHFQLAWRTHAAPWPPEYTFWQRAVRNCAEAQYCLKLKLLGFPVSRFLPQPA
jgi:uncharacterized SAM-binding protein YcdF (DUF218 family)